MSASTIAVWVLLAFALACYALTAVGMLVMRDVLEKIQYVYPTATLGIFALVAAIVVNKPISQTALKSILTAVIVLLVNPALSHATARAAQSRKFEGQILGDAEHAPELEDVE